MKKKVYSLVLASMLVAVSVIVSRLLSPVINLAGIQGLRVDLSYGIIIFAGCVLGPGYGAAVGFLTDFIGALVFPIGVYYPGFTISCMLLGLIPGLLHLLYGRRKLWYLYHFITVTVSCAVNNILGTYWLKLYYGKVFGELVYVRLTSLVIIVPVTYAVSLLLIAIYKKYRKKSR